MGSRSPRTYVVGRVAAVILLVLFIGLCCSAEAKRLDSDLMFDDNTPGALNTKNQFSHENARTKVVSKRSVSDPSDKTSEVTFWQRIKRGIANFFGYGGDEEVKPPPPIVEVVEEPKVAALRAEPISAHAHHEADEIQMQENNTQRRRRQYDDDEDDDEDNEIEGSSDRQLENENELESTSDNEVDSISLLPDVPDDKYFRIKLEVHEMWDNLKDKHSTDYKSFAATVKRSLEDLYKSKSAQHGTIMANLVEVREFPTDSFKVVVTINIAADAPKISGNELRDIISSDIKTYQRLGDHVVEPNSFSITNLEESEYLETSAIETNESDLDIDSEEAEVVTDEPEATTPQTVLDEDGPIDNDEENNLSVDTDLLPDEKPTIVDDCRSDDKFRCGNTSVFICEIQKCDEKVDCPNGEDEENCLPDNDSNDFDASGNGDDYADEKNVEEEEEVKATTAELSTSTAASTTTTSTTTTVTTTFIESIEGEVDSKSEETIECGANEFNCDVTRCIPNDKYCDKTLDCDDGTDEDNCPEPTTTELPLCNDDEFTCNDGSCITLNDKCNGHDDCPEGDDEDDCDGVDDITDSCDGFQCSDGTCIDNDRRCDGRIDCPNSEDEDDCNEVCTIDEYKCRSGKCIPQLTVCDEATDCPDGDDEEDCECARNEFRCLRGGLCIAIEKKCDEISDCPDDSDEYSCLKSTIIPYLKSLDNRANITSSSLSHHHVPTSSRCKETDFQCVSDGACVDGYKFCNGYPDCTDRSDEMHCNNNDDYEDVQYSDECSSVEFRCDEKCIPISFKCDGVQDCEDLKDEENCPPQEEEVEECHDNQFQCGDLKCIDINDRCNAIKDCDDDSDEQNCDDCTQDNFHCRISRECIFDRQRCDGREDCQDGTDEHDCESEGESPDAESNLDNFECISNEFRCDNGQCINKEFLCDGHADCLDQSDESALTCNNEVEEIDANHCEVDQFFCDGRCIEQERVCDNNFDCRDRTDEQNCPDEQECPEDKCADGSCIYAYQRCDGNIDCSQGEDESGCPCRDNEFRCNDGTCLPANARCNRRVECPDGSDEASCSARCRPGEFQCSTGECISDSRKCDRHVDCRDGSDEANCHEDGSDCTRDMFWCENGPCIMNSLRCNGRVDCPFDDSDELDCPPSRGPSSRPEEVRLNLKTYPNEQTIKESREVVFQCRDEGPMRARVHWIGKNNRPLPPNTRDLNGRLEIPNIKVEHSGEYICEAVGYPRSTPGSSVSVYLNVEKYNRSEWSSTPLACGANQATCMNGECIARTKICDGVFDCTDGSDENGCRSGRCEPNEYQCSNRKCVLKTWRCDGENDCGDNSDEEGCSALSQPSSGSCRYDEFQCSNDQCIPKSFQCDSQPDCSDNSDEVGCLAPAVITPPPALVRVQAGHVFNITCRATGKPVPLIVWRLNWGHIPEKCRTTSVDGFGTLTCPDIQPIDSGAYSCEIINSMGTHFVSPDTILVVSGHDVCPVGYFNEQAARKEDCINCFCFGVSTQCKSADLFTYALNPPVTSQTVVGIDGPWSGLQEIAVSEFDKHSLTSTRHGIQFRLSDLPAVSNNVYPYLALPNEYHGNQLKSYGGFLRYEVEFTGRGQSNDKPDVIIQGNGYTLTYSLPSRIYPNSRNNVTAQLTAQNWHKLDGTHASREEVMMVLADVTNILIKLQYLDSGERSVDLLHVTLDSAALRDFGLGSASLVEECRCPTGYTGLSCESCDVGYVRQRSGPWLGRCVPEEEPCRTGTYGDPSRGIPCKPCPCPVPGNSRARTCSLERNGDVVCHCDRGYIGPRCEQCAPGYIGNPMSPRGCTPAPQPPPSDCNPYGTERILQNGQCKCKPNVVGRFCDQCSAQTFHLNSRSGCINCFCMGVTTQCSSSSYFRDTIRASFSSPTTDFALVSGYEDAEPIASRLRVENREIAYRDFAVNDETYYWSLPPTFLGNIITAYGGNLTYTVRYVSQPSGGQSRSNSPDVVIVSGNEITLHHYRQDTVPPFGTQTFIVPVYEDSWQHYEDGGVSATRQHLLMTLANVTAIYIKATYTTVAEEAALSQVSLDVAKEQNYGSNQRAYEVESCTCPVGHQGLSCEDCSPGFYKGEQGLYLGLCEPCECNGHSSECDSKTGICMNCRDNTYGDNCEYCLPGFEGNATSGGCIPIGDGMSCGDCSEHGTSSCDQRSRTCNCKPNAVGIRCDECREGTFGLSEVNPYGCTECFCSGATRSCSEGIYYREQIPLFIFEVADQFALTDRDGNNALPNDAFETIIEENEISYQFTDDAHTYYWNLPDRLSGNLIVSYGGKLQLTQRTDGSGPYVEDQDVIVRGNGLTIAHSRRDLEDETWHVNFVESEWQTLHRSGPRPASRADLLTVLSNVESILVRASTRSYTSESRISDITLDTAVRQPTPSGRVHDIETCRCPPGYRGTSCELCEANYYRDTNDRSAGLLGSCKMCPCDNAESCQLGPNRRVVCNCIQGWTGEMCRERVGAQPPVTQPPVRPPSIQVDITTPHIKIVELGETIEFNCNAYYIINNRPVGIRWYKYEGQLSERTRVEQGSLYIEDAQVSDSGIYICQAQVGSEIIRDNVTLTVGDSYPSAPRIIVEPRVINQEEFAPAEITCSASGYPQPHIEWSRIDGNYLSTDVVLREGYLRFNALRKSDEGTYRCTASNDVDQTDVVVQVYVRQQQRPPVREEVRIEPDQFSGEPGDEVKLYCNAVPQGEVTWSKLGSVGLPDNVYVSGEELVIQYTTASDSGRYICSVRFPNGVQRQATVDVTITARSNEQAPTIKPLEQRYTVTQGQDFELICDTTGMPYPTVTWSMSGGPLAANARQNGNVLRILNIRPENSGVYVCLATNNAGSDQAATVVDVERREPPVIEIFPKEPQKLRVGESTRFNCRATSGTPHPTLTWVRRDGKQLSSRITEDIPGTITLRDAILEDAGVYECRASNIAGETSLSTTLDVSQPPTIQIYPDVQNFDLTEGDELKFNCIATGSPAPSVRIKAPDGVPQLSGIRTSEIRRDQAEATISHYNIQRSQAGLYECIATNEAGQDVRYIQVNVAIKRVTDRPQRPNPPVAEPTGRPIQPSRPPPEQPPFTVHVGERAELNCNAEGNSMSTEWRRADNQRLPQGTRIYGGQLIIENVGYDAAGSYECLAYDRYRRPITLLLAQIVVVSGPPKIIFSPPMPIAVRSGEDVIIYCNATGEGPVRVHWHGEGGTRLPSSVEVSGNYLRFSRIAPADEGRYVCTASNLYGNTTKVAEVIVDHNNPPETDHGFGRTKEGYEGDTVQLTCSDESRRGNIRYEWEKEDDSLPPLAENRDNVLILHNTRFEDGGRYICKIYTDDGRVTQNYVDLVIKPPIPFLTLEPSKSYVKPGGFVEVECTSSVGPDVQVTWEGLNGARLPYNFEQYGNRLIISNVQRSDSGKYNCVCRDDEGQLYMSEYELVVDDSSTPSDIPAPLQKVEHAEVGSNVVLRCNSQRPGATHVWTRQHGSFAPDVDTNSDILKLINVQASDAGTYICTALSNGQVIKIPTTLVVTGAIPFFPQSPRSYMKFPKLDQAYSKFNFEITFRPERPNGLILYNGQRRGSGDYIALSIVGGIPQFRYSFGDQHGILKPEKPLTLGEWHTIKVNRVRTNGWMIVDDQHPVIFPPNQKFQGLNLEEELYIGGVPKYEHLPPTASEVSEGFVGCISRLVLNERDIQLNQEALYTEGTTSCEPCADEPCQNEGVCLETQTDHGYTCVCPEGFTGRNCQVLGFQCSLGACGIGRCGETETGIECYCPLNRTGDHCQYIEHYGDGILSFRDGSYAAYDKLTGKKNIKFKIRPESNEDGVILYAAESERAYGDFIAVVVKDKHIEFRYIVGGKVLPVIIRSQNPIKVHEWMDVSVGRSRAGLGYLQVDNEPQMNEQKSAGRAQTLYLKTNLYIGGYDKRIVLNRGVGVTKGFQGCVAGLEIATKSVDMIKELRDSANVQNCGHQPAIIEDESSGDDFPETTSNEPLPNCRAGYGGRRCDIITDICLAQEPCENGGICTKLPGDKFNCDCTLGYTGERCQYMVQIDTSAAFRGNGYLELDHKTIANSTLQLASGIALLFSTKSPNGLIFWYGQNKGHAFNGEDFLALAVNDGMLEFAFRLDGEESFVRHHGIRVDTNQRHIAILKRTGNQASLELDGLTEYGETRPTGTKEMKLPGHVFLGGAPDLRRFTGDRYVNGFVGCIHIVEPIAGGAIKLGENTISSVNVEQCSDADDEIDLGTEPPVV